MKDVFNICLDWWPSSKAENAKREHIRLLKRGNVLCNATKVRGDKLELGSIAYQPLWDR